MEAYTNSFISRKRRSLIVLSLLFTFLVGYEFGIRAKRPQPLDPSNFQVDLPIEPSAIECSKRQGVPCA